MTDPAKGGKAMSEVWQPIETAPRDGTVVDLWDRRGFRVTNKSWRVHKWQHGEPMSDPEWGPYREVPIDPTHWMPLPPTPAAKEGE